MTLSLLIAMVPSLAYAGGIVFERTASDLGKRRASGTIEETFAFRITGNQPVQIVDLVPSCGCVVPTLERRTYQPGETGEIRFGIHTTSQKSGPKDYKLGIAVRDPAPRTHVLTVSVELFSEITIEPSNLLIYLRGKQPLRQAIRIRDHRPEVLRVTDVVSSSPRITTKKDRGSSGTNVRQVNVTIDAAAFAIGRHEERIEIRTDDPDYPLIDVPVTVVRMPRVSAFPDKIWLYAHSKDHAKRQVLLRDERGEPVRIVHVESSIPGAQLDWSKEKAPLPSVMVGLDPNMINVDAEPQVSITVAEPIEATIVVPVGFR
ncbi:DUF1573 domain-containing protein [Kolteria novifilia]|uniref:DUF1573 domain-containing protein n=1 Tax=Kolteria novifilia TaxID=2527975 RepID=UPI003AF3F811